MLKNIAEKICVHFLKTWNFPMRLKKHSKQWGMPSSCTSPFIVFVYPDPANQYANNKLFSHEASLLLAVE